MTDKEINEYLSSQSTTDVPTILEGTEEVYNDIILTTKKFTENSIIGLREKKCGRFDKENTLINYNLQGIFGERGSILGFCFTLCVSSSSLTL